MDDTPSDVGASHDEWHDSSQWFLFTVPINQRRENPQVYEPDLFFFGPYQHASLAENPIRAAASIAGEHLKQQVAKALLEEGQLQELAHKIASHYSEIKQMYPQMTSQQWERVGVEALAEKMAMDAVTVAASGYLYACSEGIETEWFDKKLVGQYCGTLMPHFRPPILTMLLEDALLQDNQLPLNVLRFAFKTLKLSSICKVSFQWMVMVYCQWGARRYLCDHEPRWPNRRASSSDCLLGAIYDSLTPIPPNDQGSQDLFRDTGSSSFSGLLRASQLAQCGIRCRLLKIELPETAPHHGFSSFGYTFTKKDEELPTSYIGPDTFRSAIRFNEKKKVIELPQIVVGDDTVRFMHNLLAYEASCRYPKECFVVSHVTFMDRLIDTEDDVKILSKAGVTRNFLGSHEELATAWNKLGKSVLLRITAEDHEIALKVGVIAKVRWRRWRSQFMDTYWKKKPWLFVSIVIAAILLVAAVVQTIFTIKSSK